MSLKRNILLTEVSRAETRLTVYRPSCVILVRWYLQVLISSAYPRKLPLWLNTRFEKSWQNENSLTENEYIYIRLRIRWVSSKMDRKNAEIYLAQLFLRWSKNIEKFKNLYSNAFHGFKSIDCCSIFDWKSKIGSYWKNMQNLKKLKNWKKHWI